ncbi:MULTISPECIES: baeRF3 domain-containing protein [Pseudonocardia]|uniref:Lantibiotic biosynthesis dehydratase-like protein n=1 Tax=Pseudonocardia saturnea TaxID=33909 RepID=A0ABQ0S9R3_9PSEU|nr:MULTISPECIES: hypothetical protein [Pseudonocardia]BBG01181.1 hypothetical protein Pdca_23900 [Pseudonocardia autotrophica]GEC29663.1 hypothetical protein PSA01_66920 [Pseudonocardia saturnea]
MDQSLGAYLRLHPAPLVLAAAQPTLATFRRLSRHTARLTGTLTGNHLSTPREQLQTRVRPMIEDYLLSRQAEALTLLAERADQGRAVHGIERAWLASRWERPEMLAVEQGYFQPARLSADGDTHFPTSEVAQLSAPDVLDDAVDELIEAVLARGGWVALLADRTLPADGRVALTLHPDPPRSPRPGSCTPGTRGATDAPARRSGTPVLKVVCVARSPLGLARGSRRDPGNARDRPVRPPARPCHRRP